MDDLDALPDDGFRYELVDGVLLVSPSPLLPHQAAPEQPAVRADGRRSRGRAGAGSSAGLRFSRTRQLQPDMVVIRRRPLRVDHPLTVERSFPVTLVPAELVR